MAFTNVYESSDDFYSKAAFCATAGVSTEV
jgi:hypothetical protein